MSITLKANTMKEANSINPNAINSDSQHESKRLKDILSRKELNSLREKSDLMGFLAILKCWSVIFITLYLMAWSTRQTLFISIPFIIAGLFILGGRQLCLAILMHDASHYSLFKTKSLNTQFVNWVCAKPIWIDLLKYRPYHLTHHRETSSENDPDLILINDLPCTRASLFRKTIRDITGFTGVKLIVGRILIDLEVLAWTTTGARNWLPQKERSILEMTVTFLKNIYPVVLTNFLIFSILYLLGVGWAYIFWAISFLTSYNIILRVRSYAEHACLETSSNMFLNTRTTKAGFLAKFTVAPLNVNFHQEHHLMASIPYFNLPKLHKLLLDKNIIKHPPSYSDVMKLVSSKA